MKKSNTTAQAAINQSPTDKLMFALLQSIYGATPGIDVRNLLNVANATPNPIAALELLTGLYEKPEIRIGETREHVHSYNKERTLRTLLDFNPLERSGVHFAYEAKKSLYLSNLEDVTFFTENGHAQDKYDATAKAYVRRPQSSVSTEECYMCATFTANTSDTCPLEEWLALPLVEEDATEKEAQRVAEHLRNWEAAGDEWAATMNA